MEGNILEIPDPLNPGRVLRFDLSEVHQAEARISEIATVNGIRAQELMGCFSKACFALGRVYPTLHMNHRLAEKKVGDRGAVVVIDVMSEAIKSKGLSNNDTTRQAILDQDPSYSQAVIDEIQTEAAKMYVERKLRDMEGAFHAVKKIHETTQGIVTRPNPNLSRDLEQEIHETTNYGGSLPAYEPELAPQTVQPQSSRVGGLVFGKPKY